MEAAYEFDQVDPTILAPRMVEALKDDRIDEAEAIYSYLCTILPGAEDLLVFPVEFAIQRGQVAEALRFINGLPEDRCPELKALCLYLMKDPSWHGIAEELEHSVDPYVRQAMRELLGRPAELH